MYKSPLPPPKELPGSPPFGPVTDQDGGLLARAEAASEATSVAASASAAASAAAAAQDALVSVSTGGIGSHHRSGGGGGGPVIDEGLDEDAFVAALLEA